MPVIFFYEGYIEIILNLQDFATLFTKSASYFYYSQPRVLKSNYERRLKVFVRDRLSKLRQHNFGNFNISLLQYKN